MLGYHSVMQFFLLHHRCLSMKGTDSLVNHSCLLYCRKVVNNQVKTSIKCECVFLKRIDWKILPVPINFRILSSIMGSSAMLDRNILRNRKSLDNAYICNVYYFRNDS